MGGLFLNWLLTLIVAYAIGLFIILATGSAVMMVVGTALTGVYVGWTHARRIRRAQSGKTE